MENLTILSSRGRTKVAHRGHLFTFEGNSSDGSKKFWRCDQRPVVNCHARLHTDMEGLEVLFELNQHNHGSDAAQVEVAKIKTKIKLRAIEKLEMPSQILNNALMNANVAILGKMPTKDAIRKMVQRTRNANAVAPPAPQDLQNIEIPRAYRQYVTEPGHTEEFLLGDVRYGDNQRMLIFGRESYSGWSNTMTDLFVDGTFSIAPPLFQQVYVILAKRGGFVFPVLYALLCDKRQETYTQFFATIKQTWPMLNPTHISIDFEIAAIQALRAAFPNAELMGCLFHLAKNFRKNLAEANLLGRYDIDAAFSVQAKMILALAFVPISSLEEAFEALTAVLPDELEPVLSCFEDNYIGRPNVNGTRRAARFPPDIWSVHDRVLNNLDRTNNFAEAAHRRLQFELSMTHPTLWKLIDGFRRLQKGQDLQYEQYVRVQPPPAKRNKYIRVDQRLTALVQTFQNRDLIEFLRGISHNLRMD